MDQQVYKPFIISTDETDDTFCLFNNEHEALIFLEFLTYHILITNSLFQFYFFFLENLSYLYFSEKSLQH